jgi:hypothetical protein
MTVIWRRSRFDINMTFTSRRRVFTACREAGRRARYRGSLAETRVVENSPRDKTWNGGRVLGAGFQVLVKDEPEPST